uniref:Tetraspanin-7 n=1 Tax=Calidris pygmaea TaxID=425635 RepID=A0A8C3J9V5_9CHAR
MASPSRRLQTKPVITCLKSVLLTYTFVFWVSGIVLLAVGVWGRVSLAVYFSLLDEKATNVPFVLVGAGTVVVLLGTFGCFATCRGSTWMLKLYAMLLSLIFLIVLVAAVVGFVFRHEIKTNFESNLDLALRDYNVTADRHSEAVDTIQRTLHCCGVQNYSDWERTEYFTQRGFPRSCCKSQDDCSEEDLKDPSKAKQKVFVDGCFFLVTSTMESKMSVVAGISFGIACFQVSLPCWPAEEGCRAELACLQRYLISVQSLVCVQKARPLSTREGQLFYRFPLGLISPLSSLRSLQARAEAPALFP